MKLSIPLLIFILLSCNDSYQKSRSQPISSQIIGGEVTPANKFKSTVNVESSCTASKVGTKMFILAAHCVMNARTGDLKNKFHTGAQIVIATHYSNNKSATIKNVFPHPSYIEVLDYRVTQGDVSGGIAFHAFDIALFEIEEETPLIPVATISSKEPTRRQTVVIGGYGCEGTDFESLYGNKPRKYKTATVSIYFEDEPFEDFYGTDVSRVSEFNFLTEGITLDSNSASICSGDSGGPVYTRFKKRLIGVNSQYIFIDASRVSYVNAHTRISAVYDWIMEIINS